ncbi:MAG: putative lipid II flippase FtsW [Candidatus Zixiibacteriota bacterium]
MRPYPDSRRFDEPLLLAYLLLVAVGLVMVYSTSSIMADSRFGSHLHFLRNQAVWTLLSLVAMFLIVRLDLRKLAVWSVPALFVSLGLLSLVFLMPARNDAHRWLMFGPLTMQPSEIFKFVMICYLAFSLANPQRDLTNLKQLLMPYGPLIGAGLLLIMLEPNLGMVILVSVTALGLFFLAGMRWKHLISATLPLAGLAALVVFVLGYKRARIIDHVDAVMDPLMGSYQVKQSALTLGSGGLLGTGLGEGRQKLFFLPYPHTDFIFSATGEEIGFIGLLFILCLLFFVLYRGFKIATSQPDKFGYLLASGMTWTLFINIAVNVGVVTAILPVTGVPLPFISYGGSSLLVSSAAIAVLLNLSRKRPVS